MQELNNIKNLNDQIQTLIRLLHTTQIPIGLDCYRNTLFMLLNWHVPPSNVYSCLFILY